jgi:hypothetical protein
MVLAFGEALQRKTRRMMLAVHWLGRIKKAPKKSELV